jgi:hypothetical protein
MEMTMSQMIQYLRDSVARQVLIGAVALFFCFGFAHNAQAEHWKTGDLNFADNNDTLDYWYTTVDLDNPSHYFSVYVWKDGTIAILEGDDGNPGPDDPEPKKGDQQSRIALAKQHGGGNWISEREFWDSPAGRSLTAGGQGPKPVINPADDDVGVGPGDPSRGKEKLGDLIIDKTGGLDAGGENGFQFNAGSPADQLHQPGGPPGGSGGGNSNDDDDKGSHKPPPGSNYGPAELVDPLGPPTGKITLGALGANTWTGKRKSGEVFLPHVEQKSLKKSSGKNKGSEHGVIAIIKPGETTGIGNPEIKDALGGPDTKGVTQNTWTGLGGHSAMNARISVGSMGGSVGRIGVGSIRVR